MNTEYKIEKNIPILTQIRQHRFPFSQMKVGDSFLVKGKKDGMSARVSAYYWGDRHKVKFKCISITKDTVRIWRIK